MSHQTRFHGHWFTSRSGVYGQAHWVKSLGRYRVRSRITGRLGKDSYSEDELLRVARRWLRKKPSLCRAKQALGRRVG